MALREILPPTNKEQQASEADSSRADRIRASLRALGKDASPKEVTSKLLESGFQWEGNGDLVTRVNSELYRMAKRKLNVKRGVRGKYRYVK